MASFADSSRSTRFYRWLLSGLLLVAMLAAGLYVVPWVEREYRIDQCLDAGGAWNPSSLECER